MRNLNECRAEVFRRSEKRIKARRQRRKHILVACIPLVLCMSVFSAFVLPDWMKRDAQDKPGAPEISNEMYSAGTVDGVAGLFAGTVDVSGGGFSCSYSSTEDVQRILGLIQDITEASAISDGAGYGGYSIGGNFTAGLDEAYREKGCRILVNCGGTQREYFLLGSMLVDQASQKVFRMDEDTCFALKNALGIPFY